MVQHSYTIVCIFCNSQKYVRFRIWWNLTGSLFFTVRQRVKRNFPSFSLHWNHGFLVKYLVNYTDLEAIRQFCAWISSTAYSLFSLFISVWLPQWHLTSWLGEIPHEAWLCRCWAQLAGSTSPRCRIVLAYPDTLFTPFCLEEHSNFVLIHPNFALIL